VADIRVWNEEAAVAQGRLEEICGETLIHAIFTLIHAIFTLIHAMFTLIHAIFTLIHAIFTLIHAILTLIRRAGGDPASPCTEAYFGVQSQAEVVLSPTRRAAEPAGEGDRERGRVWRGRAVTANVQHLHRCSPARPGSRV
jgi:hypothetical protein